MSWKIHKALGYGITGLQVEDGRLTDTRINLKSPGLSWDEEDTGKWSHQSWLRYLEERNSEDTGMLVSLARNFVHRNPHDITSLSRNVIYSNEGGDPGTLLIIPPGLFTQNYRFNSQIDRYESVFRLGQSMKPTVDILPSGIAPWNGWMHAGSLNKLDGTCHDLLDWILTEAPPEQVDRGYKALAKYLELDVSPAEMRMLIMPEIPDSIRIFAEWMSLFKTPDALLSLRPMVYTYWT